jgi:SnoaL-like domain
VSQRRDREEILDVVARYAHTVDERNIDGIAACFAAGDRRR